MMWFLLLLINIAHIEQVVVQRQDVNRLILKNENDPCEGHVKIYHNGTWGYAGDTNWNTSTEDVVCRSTHCGKPVESINEDTPIPTGSTVWLNEIACSGNESYLWDCSAPGWNISVYLKDTVKTIKCSNRINITLDGFQCAGAVQYSIDGKTPSGYFCDDNWGHKEADLLCESLQCGKSKEIPKQDWMVWKRFHNSAKMKIQCSGIQNEIHNLWQCVTQKSTCKNPASVICQDHERLQLSGNSSNVCSGTLEKEENGKWITNNIKTNPDVSCRQMYCGEKSHNPNSTATQLTCTDEVKVQLEEDISGSQCSGSVVIVLNKSVHSVCGSDWTSTEADVVCKELGCGKAIITETKSSNKLAIMDNVNCSGSESSLWHCRAKRDKDIQCSSSPYVVCEKSLHVRLADGPGICAGRVEIMYAGKWKQVNKIGWTDENSDTVCKSLSCGNKRNTELFRQGLGDFFPKTVKCKTNTLKISDCISNDPDNSQREKEAVGLTCEEHKVVFLSGRDACSGMVGIEQGSKTYWLSGSNNSWNQNTANTVCRQMDCGDVKTLDVISNADVGKRFWEKYFNCSSGSKSLFQCKITDASPDYNDTIANVTCSGKVTVKLTEGCWGFVNFTTGNKSGGVCADAWTETQSKMLCEELGCGETILTPTFRLGGIDVIFKSLHSTKETHKLNQCNFVKMDENGNKCKKDSKAYVVCSGSIKPKINYSRDKCSGNVELSYEGKWLPMCQDALQDPKIQNIICEELECGQAVSNINYFGPTRGDDLAISVIQCPNSATNFKACNITVERRSCTLGGLKCAKWRKVKVSDTCGGTVSVRTDKVSSPVSSIGWEQSEVDRLCKDLNCGNMKSMKGHNTSQKVPFWSTTFRCANETNAESIWACEINSPPTQKQQQLFIECHDKPNVTLSGTCTGDVKINEIEVCSTTWSEKYSHLVCQEQDCSNAIVGLTMSKKPKSDAEYYHVMCEDYHYKLGQCKRYKGKCTGTLVTVSCVKNIKFRTKEKCGGQIEVKYRDNNWEAVCPMTFSAVLFQKMCHSLGCGDYNVSITGSKLQSKKLTTLKTTLDYTADHMDLRHCVRAKACGEVKSAEIYCNNYQPPPPPVPQPRPLPVVQIILGVGVVLILVILIVIFVRIYIIKRARNAMKLPLRMMSQKEMEFESGEFEDMKENEMEDFDHGRFRSEAEVTMENDRRSASSLPYDDIDEVSEAQPLTTRVIGAGASGGNYEDRNGVTYEVEDPHESYDDIDASSEITQTKAEVHDSPQVTPESSAVAPPEFKQEEDYLVPGQDG